MSGCLTGNRIVVPLSDFRGQGLRDLGVMDVKRHASIRLCGLPQLVDSLSDINVDRRSPSAMQLCDRNDVPVNSLAVQSVSAHQFLIAVDRAEAAEPTARLDR